MRHWHKALSLTVATLLAITTRAGQADDYDRVEEDWEIVIGEPSPQDEAPQILNVISPQGTQSGEFYVFELNHSTQPEYAAGGMQLQRWTGDTVRGWKSKNTTASLAIPGETIRYTLRMRVIDNDLWVSVRNGTSQTWGTFGGDELRLWSGSTFYNLNSYRTSHSTSNSRVGFASYRVTSFVLKEVRYYSNGELVQTDETDRVVHEYNP